VAQVVAQAEREALAPQAESVVLVQLEQPVAQVVAQAAVQAEPGVQRSRRRPPPTMAVNPIPCPRALL